MNKSEYLARQEINCYHRYCETMLCKLGMFNDYQNVGKIIRACFSRSAAIRVWSGGDDISDSPSIRSLLLLLDISTNRWKFRLEAI